MGVTETSTSSSLRNSVTQLFRNSETLPEKKLHNAQFYNLPSRFFAREQISKTPYAIV